jgi:hypothetical protein
VFKGEIYPSPVPASNEMIVAPDLEDEGMWIGTLLIGGGLGIGLLAAVAL